MFQALLQDRAAAGSDINPVAVCVSGAKCDPPRQHEVEARLAELRHHYLESGPSEVQADRFRWEEEVATFFALCFHPETLEQLLFLRSVLDWRHRKDDRFIAAVCLGAIAWRIASVAQLFQQSHAANDQHQARIFGALVAK